MSSTYKSEIISLLNQSHVGFLATTGNDGPESSMAPYAIHHGTVLLHLSGLARHTGNITSHPKVGFIICTPETIADSPLALPRLSLQGDVTPVSGEQLQTARQAYLNAIPDAEPLFGFSDFTLFKLSVSTVHWVGGFGSANKIAVSDWHSLLSSETKNHG